MSNIEKELISAVESDDIKMAEAVFNSGEKFNINLQSSNGDTLLHMVKSPEMAELLLKNGIDTTIQNNEGATALGKFFERIYLGNIEKIVTSLINNGIDINAAAYYDEPPVIKIANNAATLSTNIEQLEYLVKLGADINIKNKQGYTPLMLAVMKSNIDMVRGLLDAGADTKLVDNKGRDAKKIGEEMMSLGYYVPALKTIISIL